ncbi:MAG: hypothetical protein NTV51_10620 [Verrucomicrobia bacterium]|nr:hypothetical protein [Verrucomicrobiota bacterium]
MTNTVDRLLAHAGVYTSRARTCVRRNETSQARAALQRAETLLQLTRDARISEAVARLSTSNPQAK